MLKHFQDNIARDISRMPNPYARYGAWGAYWFSHGVGLIAAWSLKLTVGLAYKLTIGKIMNPPQKKKKKGH